MSSTRSIVKKFSMIPDEANSISASMAASITSAPTYLDKIDQVAIQIAWTSADAIGVITIQGCIDVDDDIWEDIPVRDPDGTAPPNPASNNGSYMATLALIPFMAVRVKYTRTSGDGTLSVKLSAKGN